MPYHHGRLREAGWGDMNKKVMESVCHQEGMGRAVELMALITPLEEQYVLICCICFLTMHQKLKA